MAMLHCTMQHALIAYASLTDAATSFSMHSKSVDVQHSKSVNNETDDDDDDELFR